MMTMLPKNETFTPVVETIKSIIGLVATCLGLAIIIIGLNYAMDIFQFIFTILKSPKNLTDPIHQMAEVILGGTSGLKMTSGSGFLANTIALTVYCGGALLCAWLTLALMHTGAKIVSLNLGDRTAVKKILQNAFGKSLQPKSTTEADAIMTRETSKP